jgi:hypothetical protein
MRARSVRHGGATMHTDQKTVTFIGNATLLFRYGSMCVLTDPNFIHCGERCRSGTASTPPD